MMPAYSSGVAASRLPEAIFGTSPVMWICMKSPSGVKISMPRGFGPNGNDFCPSGAVTSATTKCQVPRRRSLRLFDCADASLQSVTSASADAATVSFIRSLPCMLPCTPSCNEHLPRARAHPDEVESGCVPDSLSGACPYRKTGVHFSGTCAPDSLSDACHLSENRRPLFRDMRPPTRRPTQGDAPCVREPDAAFLQMF